MPGAAIRSFPRSSGWAGLIPTSCSIFTLADLTASWCQLSTVAEIRNSTVPRSLNRFQQLNAVKISGVAMRPLNEALRFLEDEAAKILPQGYVVDYTGESRQLRTEGYKFLPAFGLAMVLIFLVLAGPV